MESPPAFNTTTTTTKGYGLKKWKRIPRDFTKEGTPFFDSAKVLKRGFSTPNPISDNTITISHNNTTTKSHNNTTPISHNNTTTISSNNTSTISSTAASLPKSTSQLLHQFDNTKKLRGQKETSMDSHSRGSLIGITSNAKPTPFVSDDVQLNQIPTSSYAILNTQQPHSPNNLSSWDEDKDQICDNSLPSTDSDPLLDSILSLQSAHQALLNEVVKLGELGRESVCLYDNSSKESNIDEASTSGQLKESLERKLEETTSMLAEKISRVVELEDALKSGTVSKEVEVETESIFRQKIEAEIVYLTITQTLQRPKTEEDDGRWAAEEQESIAAAAGVGDKDYYEVVSEAEEALKAQRGVYKLSIVFFMQFLLLLALLFFLFRLQLQLQQQESLPDFEDAVPT